MKRVIFEYVLRCCQFQLELIVLCRDKRAVGVEYITDPVTHPGADDALHVVRASRLVVVSGGAFGSPTILERSGIGGQGILQQTKIEQIVDLPGVGENYQGQMMDDGISRNILADIKPLRSFWRIRSVPCRRLRANIGRHLSWR